MPYICFDLEGPLSPQDHAYEVMKLIPFGQKLFEVISRYDDILTIEERESHEPGETLKFITPFIISGGITESDLKKISQEAKLMSGAKELIDGLQKSGWQVFIISSSFEQHALNIAGKLGVSQLHVFSTKFPLDKFREKANREEIGKLGLVRDKIISLRGEGEIKSFLDNFFRHVVPREYPTINEILGTIQVMGGSRKAEAVESIRALF